MPSEFLDFSCPRCASSVTEPLYGPCAPCRVELRASLGAEPVGAVDETVAAFDPKMNVTPNAVALKE
jgi:hypothetical protein